MLRKSKCFLAIVMVMIMLLAIVGCSNNENTSNNTNQDNSNTNTSNNDSKAENNDDMTVYPLEGNRKITYWTGAFIHPDYATMADTPLMKEIMEKTGVEVEFIHQEGAEAFSLLVASGDLPDVYKQRLNNFPGGPTAALEQGVAIPLNEYMDKYAPNLSTILKKNPEWDKLVKTDEGQYYSFPFIRGDDYLTVFVGPMLRKDWLDELSLSVPETIDDWYNVLKTFKEEKEVAAPLTGEFGLLTSSNAFVGAYDASFDYYVNSDGKVEFGPAQSGFKDFMKLLLNGMTKA